MKQSLLLPFVLLASWGSSLPLLAAPVTSSSTTRFRPVKLWNAVQDKNFYLLSLIEHTPGAINAINANSTLKQLAANQTSKLVTAFNGGNPSDIALPTFLWATADIDAVTEALKSLYRRDPTIKNMVEGPLRQSGMYARYNNEAGEELLSKAWRDAASGINHVIQVYGQGEAPRYPKIDSPFYDVKSGSYAEVMTMIFGTLAEDDSAHQLFFQPSLRVALGLMEANRRDEAGRLEPMEQKENSAAYKRIPKVDWAKYPYSLILAPGHGPNEEDVPLSPEAKLQLAAIAHRFKQGKSPFILVSGGYVHPAQTPYCEALEMKKSLMNDYGIPENAILIDPHARHTTTNMRNAARLIYRYGMPADKYALITTTPSQIRSINSPAFQKRCNNELGYQPMQLGKLVSPLDLEFRPTLDSLQIDPIDPLDP